jgi:hypothetical protein
VDLIATFVHSLEQSSNFRVMASALGYHGASKVIGKEYFMRQAAILFGLAKATRDPEISAALLDKAADLKSQVDGPGTSPDLTPRAPDVLPPASYNQGPERPPPRMVS